MFDILCKPLLELWQTFDLRFRVRKKKSGVVLAKVS